jgi:hypothetical protein
MRLSKRCASHAAEANEPGAVDEGKGRQVEESLQRRFGPKEGKTVQVVIRDDGPLPLLGVASDELGELSRLDGIDLRSEELVVRPGRSRLRRLQMVVHP